MSEEIIPVHQWTADDGRVWVVKCADKYGKGYDGFQYPAEVGAMIKPAACSLTPDCSSGGLFGWAWGIGFGVDKEPDYGGVWFVIAAPKEQVVAIDGLGGKVKIAAASPDDVRAEIIYRGDTLGAMMKTHAKRIAWIQHSARGNAAASGWRGNAAASGERGNAAASGERGNAAASGWRGNAAASGERGNAAASGWRGNAAASGWRGNAAASGAMGNAAASGAMGNAAASGAMGNAAASGWRGNAAASGARGIAALSGEYGAIEVGPQSLGACTANVFTWRVHSGAVVACRWKDGEVWKHRLLVADDLSLKEGATVTVRNGEIS